jgi:hypothetical protein
MSMGAKEVLIKSVAQVISTYVIRVFKVPSMLCEKLTQMRKYCTFGGTKKGDNAKCIVWLGRSS